MKKTILYSIAIAASATTFGQVTDGLVMSVPFTYGAVYDEVGSNHGTNTGAIPTADRFGAENMAYYFDGTSYITFGDNSSTDLDVMDAISISVWVYPQSATGTRSIVTKWNESTSEQYGVFQNGTEAMYAVRTVNNIGTNVPIVASMDWHHVVFTYDKSNNEQKFYYDGILLSTTTSVGTYANSVNSTFLSIGAQYNDLNGIAGTPSRYFVGSIDDLRIYDRVLSVEEVDSLDELAPVVCENFEIDMIQVTNTGTNTGSATFNVHGGHAPYQYSFDGGANQSIPSGKVCGQAYESNSLSMTASLGTFRSVNFASYGAPTGSCGTFIYGNCHLMQSFIAAEDSLLGNSTGNYLGANMTFGVDPCFGIGKNTRIMASYAEDVTISNLSPGTYSLWVFDSLGCSASVTINVINTSVGINEPSSPSFEIYPNPSTGELTIITVQPETLFIHNVAGELISVINVQQQETIDISHLPSGVYFMNTQNGQTQRLMKK